MNTILKTISLVLAAAIPAAFSIESLGISVPAAFGAGHIFGAFVVALTLLTATNDYRKESSDRLVDHVFAPAMQKSSLRLAA